MTESGGKKAVAYSAVFVAGSVALNSMVPVPTDEQLKAQYPNLGKGILPPMRMLIGVGVTFTILSLVAEPAPELAGMFAIAIAFSAGVMYALPMLDAYFIHTDPNSGKVQTP